MSRLKELSQQLDRRAGELAASALNEPTKEENDTINFLFDLLTKTDFLTSILNLDTLGRSRVTLDLGNGVREDRPRMSDFPEVIVLELGRLGENGGARANLLGLIFLSRDSTNYLVESQGPVKTEVELIRRLREMYSGDGYSFVCTSFTPSSGEWNGYLTRILKADSFLASHRSRLGEVLERLLVLLTV